MVITMRNNLNLLRKKRLFKKGDDFFSPDGSDYTTSNRGIPSEPISKEKLLAIKKDIREQNRKQRKRIALILLITFPLSVLLIYYTFKDFEFGFPDISSQTELAQKELTKQQKKDRFLFFLNDGDKWLTQKKYHNAIFQYKKALELYPSEYRAHYRLAVTYSYQCQYEFKGCEEGYALIKKLETQFPHATELESVKTVFEHWATP